MKRTVICIILWALVIGWIGFLFSMSIQPAKVSGKMSGKVLEEIYVHADDNTVDKEKFDKDLFVRANQGRIRRIAHSVTFALLGVFSAVAALYTFGRSIKGFVTAPVICILYSFADELIQLTADGRSFEWSDLSRDLLGTVIGIFTVYLIYYIFKRIKAK